MQGLAEWRPQRCPARLAVPLRRRPGRETLHLARVESIDGERVAHPVASTGSGDVLSIARANGFVITPPDAGDQPAGTLLASLAF
jgi:molybdopterin biosynthesis enzyme